MHASRILLTAFAASSLLGLAGTAVAQTAPATHGPRCGTRQIPRSYSPPPIVQAAAGTQRVIYLNRFGGTYSVTSRTDSAANTASTDVVNDSRRSITIPPLESGFDWPGIVTCVKQAYAPYDIRIVENEPTSGPYIEAVVGGDGTELGFPVDQLFGIASADNFCGVTETGIAFSFSETHRGVPQRDGELCATIAHEVGHLLALEHETLATDMMSYVLVSETTSKSFVNMLSPCGVQPGQNQNCTCGGAQTNSAARLGQFVGTRPIETVDPTVRIDAPGDDDTVPPSFQVKVTASDDTEMADVAVLVDGIEAGIDGSAENGVYTVDVRGVSIGGHTITAVARDRAGNTAEVQRTITVALLGDGADCTGGDQCEGGQCATSADGNFCTRTCGDGAGSCGDGFACSDVGNGVNLCVPDDSGGCCSTSDGGSPAPVLLLGLGVGLVIVRRRRKA